MLTPFLSERMSRKKFCPSWFWLSCNAGLDWSEMSITVAAAVVPALIPNNIRVDASNVGMAHLVIRMVINADRTIQDHHESCTLEKLKGFTFALLVSRNIEYFLSQYQIVIIKIRNRIKNQIVGFIIISLSKFLIGKSSFNLS
jgi:hypothetical protein